MCSRHLHCVQISTRGGTRTRTTLLPEEFKSSMSTIPSPWLTRLPKSTHLLRYSLHSNSPCTASTHRIFTRECLESKHFYVTSRVPRTSIWRPRRKSAPVTKLEDSLSAPAPASWFDEYAEHQSGYAIYVAWCAGTKLLLLFRGLKRPRRKSHPCMAGLQSAAFLLRHWASL